MTIMRTLYTWLLCELNLHDWFMEDVIGRNSGASLYIKRTCTRCNKEQILASPTKYYHSTQLIWKDKL